MTAPKKGILSPLSRSVGEGGRGGESSAAREGGRGVRVPQQERGAGEVRVVAAIPGRIRLRLAPAQARQGGLERCAQSLAALPSVSSVEVIADAASIVVRYAPQEHSLAAMLREVEAHAKEFEPPRRQEKTERNRGKIGKPLLFPTVAVALAAIEVAPVAMVGSALALAALPIVGRTGRSIARREFTPDSLDLATVALLAIQGEFLFAGVISWLIALNERMGDQSEQAARQRIANLRDAKGRQRADRMRLAPSQARALFDAIENAPVTDTSLQNTLRKRAEGLMGPSFGVAAAAFLLTLDPLMFIGLLKPRVDFISGLGFAAPTTALNALAATARDGIFFTSASAIERMAQVNAIVFAETGRPMERELLTSLIPALLQRGIRRLVMPTDAGAWEAQGIADRMGIAELVAGSTPADTTPEEIANRLRAQGHRVALVGGGAHPVTSSHSANVRIALDATLSPKPDVVLLNADLNALPRALDQARETLRLLEQNTTIMAGASTINMMAALTQIAPPPFSSLLNASATAVVSRNARRPRRA